MTVQIQWPSADNNIPREVFTDQALYRLEMDRLFRGPLWFIVAHEAELPNPGDFKTTTIGDIPIIVLRDKNGEIHVFLNSCSHRTTKLLQAPCGNVKSITCVYHYWTYSLDGTLTSCSMPEDFPADFRKEDFGLMKLNVDRLAGCVFASFANDVMPLAEYLGDAAPAITAIFAADDRPLKFLGYQKFRIGCNWKLWSENMYDAYHATILHKAFQLMKLRSGGGAIHGPGRGHVINEMWSKDPTEAYQVLRDTSVVQVKTKQKDPERDAYPSVLMNIFPCSTVNDQFDVIAIRYTYPRGVDQTEIHMAYFAREGESDAVIRQRVRQSSGLYGPEGMVTLEDACVLERIQQGAMTRGEHVVVKGVARKHPPYRGVDEAHIRAFYEIYREIMGL